MYGRGQNTIGIMLVSFMAGYLFATFFNVVPKSDSPIAPASETRRG